MTKLLLALGTFLLVSVVQAQILPVNQNLTFNYITASEYDSLKINGLLTGNEVIQSEGMVTVKPEDIYKDFVITPKAQGCGGYFDPPGTSLAVTSPDDGWLVASPLLLPFTFCFFGDNYTQVWMNNNGNISFTSGISAYSSNAFPSAGNEMIAAYWADFDLSGTGTMHATITPTAAIFNWVETGYFSGQTDKINTCQIVITDGTDPLVVGGNCAIHYDDMQWTTGSASGGTGGFGGTPATAGANRGNNIDYFQIGQFDHEGIDYDGPNGAVDGVSWLDDKSFFFDFCTAGGGNIAPIPLQTAYCDTFTVCSVGDTLDISFPFLSPENTQITTVNHVAPTLVNQQIISNVPGVSGEITLQIIGALEAIGIHEITITATDDFVPAGQTIITYYVEVFDGALAFPVEPIMDFTTSCAPMTFSVLNGPYDGYDWGWGITSDTITINNYYNDVLSVTLEQGGCKFFLDSVVYVPTSPTIDIQGNLEYCEGGVGSFVQIGDSIAIGNITWGLSDPNLDNNFHNTLMAGTYTVTASDSLLLCSSDTTFTVTELPGPSIQGDTTSCDLVTFLQNTVSYNGGVWSAPDTAIHFLPDAYTENPEVYTHDAGTYTLIYTDSTCNQSVSMEVTFPPYIWVILPEDTTVCVGAPFELNAAGDVDITSWSWSNGSTAPIISVTEPGFYSVDVASECDTDHAEIYIEHKLCDIEAPNIVSLSSTKGNNIWYVQSEGIATFECIILNRWGSLVYSFNNASGGWNGRDLAGKVVNEGTYFYTIDAVLESGDEIQKHGFIQVVH